MFIAFEYNRVTRRYLKYVKFKSSFIILDEMMSLCKERAQSYFNYHEFTGNNSILLPIPSHTTRVRERGYNQSILIAKYVSMFTGVRVDTSILNRVVNTKPQTKVRKSNRQKNVINSFKVNTGANTSKLRKVILIDDVVTSGSTINEVAKTIYEHSPHLEIHSFSLFRPKPKF